MLVRGDVMTIPLGWSRLTPLLVDTHEVIAVELQGQGRTANIDRDFTPANNATDVSALLGHLGIERAAIIGHSTGAALTLHMARRLAAGAFRSVISSNSAPRGLPVHALRSSTIPMATAGRCRNARARDRPTTHSRQSNSSRVHWTGGARSKI